MQQWNAEAEEANRSRTGLCGQGMGWLWFQFGEGNDAEQEQKRTVYEGQIGPGCWHLQGGQEEAAPCRCCPVVDESIGWRFPLSRLEDDIQATNKGRNKEALVPASKLLRVGPEPTRQP